MYKLPSAKTIHHLMGNITMGQAKIIRAIIENFYDDEYDMPGHPSHIQAKALGEINKVLNGHGVEGCTELNEHDEFDCINARWTAQYVNMGDTYAPTIIFLTGDHPKRWTEGFKLMCYGDLYE